MPGSPITPEWLAAIEEHRKAVEAYRTHVAARKDALDFEAWYQQAWILHEMVQTAFFVVAEARRNALANWKSDHHE